VRNPFKVENSGSDKLLLEMMRDQNKRLAADVEWKQKRIEDLTNQILTMKREGFTWAPPLQSPHVERVDERIMVAIRSKAKEGSQLEKDLYDYAQSQLIMDVEIEDVVDAILAGREVD
jgi:Mg2+ and Co2+ transporter CorA